MVIHRLFLRWQPPRSHRNAQHSLCQKTYRGGKTLSLGLDLTGLDFMQLLELMPFLSLAFYSSYPLLLRPVPTLPKHGKGAEMLLLKLKLPGLDIMHFLKFISLELVSPVWQTSPRSNVTTNGDEPEQSKTPIG